MDDNKSDYSNPPPTLCGEGLVNGEYLFYNCIIEQCQSVTHSKIRLAICINV